MQTETKEAGRESHRAGHVVPMKVLLGVFMGLVILTILTVAASKFDFGEYNLLIALMIAVMKASLVVLFFMHLLWDKRFNAVVFVGCLIFVGLFIGLTLLDTVQYSGSKVREEAQGMKHVPLRGVGP